MTESYILYIDTQRPVQSVLETIFKPKSIAPLEGTNILYARGLVYLAHAQALPENMQGRLQGQFGFAPTISIRYFPDGVSSVNTAMQLLAEGVLYCLHESQDNIVLSTNKTEIFKRVDNQVSVNNRHSFWTPERLALIDVPYTETE